MYFPDGGGDTPILARSCGATAAAQPAGGGTGASGALYATADDLVARLTRLGPGIQAARRLITAGRD